MRPSSSDQRTISLFSIWRCDISCRQDNNLLGMCIVCLSIHNILGWYQMRFGHGTEAINFNCNVKQGLRDTKYNITEIIYRNLNCFRRSRVNYEILGHLIKSNLIKWVVNFI